MNIKFEQARKSDIDALIDLRIAYMVDDFGHVSEHEEACMREQLLDYFARKLGDELVAFVAREDEQIVAVAYLHIIEMPANSVLLNGKYGEVLSVYTKPSHRGNGLCSQLMNNLVDYAKEIGLGRVDLSATKAGYPIYKKVGFKDREARYTPMRYSFD